MADTTSVAPAPRVLHVLTTAQRRGAETYARSLDRALAADGLASRAIALRGAPAGSPALDVEVLDPRGTSTLRQLRGLWSAVGDADVVVAHGSRSLPLSALIGAARRRPFVYRVIGDTRHWAAGPLRRHRVGALLRRAAAVVTYFDAASEAVAATHRLDPARVHTIRKGIDPTLVDDVGPAARAAARDALGLDERPVLLALGALAPEKDLELAVAAAALLPDTVLALVGDGPTRDALARRAEAVGATVLLPGATDDPWPWLLAADVVLLTSRTEGVPGALLEAALAGTPAVALDVGGVREVVEHGVTGLVVEERSPAAVAAAAREVLADRAAMGAAARRHATERCDLRAVSARWASLLRSVAR